MWVMIQDAFLSIVENRHDKRTLLVRARAAEDIPTVFPRARMTVDRTADYPYRAVIDRAEVAGVVASMVRCIDYDNFKDAVPENDRHDAYLAVWHVMRDWQSKRVRRRAPVKPWPKARKATRQKLHVAK